jgi:hypothetical protein
MYDHWIKLDFWTSWEGFFFDLGLISSVTLPTQTQYPLLLGEVQIFLDNTQIDHERTIYNFLDLVGDLGGVMEIFTLALGIFIFPLSEFSFLLKAISILYLARTEDQGLLEEMEPRNKHGKQKSKNLKEGVPETLKGTSAAKEAGLHKPIKLSFGNSIYLFFLSKFERCSCCLKYGAKRTGKMLKLFIEGSERLERELNVERILKILRDVKLVMKLNLDKKYTEKKFVVNHSRQNVIDLDSDNDFDDIKERLKVAPKELWKKLAFSNFLKEKKPNKFQAEIKL